jgi:uncharacterized protein (TIGR03083 family)
MDRREWPMVKNDRVLVPPRLEPDDLLRAARLSREALSPLADKDWSLRAHDLEWSCRHTVGHISRALSSYSLHLANRATARIHYPATDDPQLTVSELITLVAAMAAVLAEVVRAAPAKTRGWHPQGLADAGGFVAMGCSEIIIHTGDIARALNAPFDPGEELPDRVARRLFPWAPADADGWSALRWGNGRIALAGRARLAPDWGWQCAPLSEWDGRIKKESR